LVLKKNAVEYLQEAKVKDLVAKHSGFASSLPIYLFKNTTTEEPIPQEEMDTPLEDPTSVCI
jgi:heat shock protein 90kDa beta